MRLRFVAMRNDCDYRTVDLFFHIVEGKMAEQLFHTSVNLIDTLFDYCFDGLSITRFFCLYDTIRLGVFVLRPLLFV